MGVWKKRVEIQVGGLENGHRYQSGQILNHGLWNEIDIGI